MTIHLIWFNIKVTVRKLLFRISNPHGTILTVPRRADPLYRYLGGEGDLQIGGDKGFLCNIFESVISFSYREYPLKFKKQKFTKDELCDHVFYLMYDYALIEYVPKCYKYFCSEGKDEFWELMKSKYNFDRPDIF